MRIGSTQKNFIYFSEDEQDYKDHPNGDDGNSNQKEDVHTKNSLSFPNIYIHLFGIQMLLLDVTRMLFRFILTGGSFSGTCTSLCKRIGET